IVELQSAGVQRLAQTSMDGKFTFPALEPGTYTLITQPATFPPGYALQSLEGRQVTVEAGKPEKTEIVVKAIRAISGKVTAYDKTQLRPVPLPDVVVRIKELSVEAHTGANGAYVFRNLPAGTFTLAVTYGQREITRQVVVPAGPTSLRDLDLDVAA